MAFEDYTNPMMLRWRIRGTVGRSRCKKGCGIEIGGSEGEHKVTVTCTKYPEEHKYENGTYHPDTDTIRGDTYELGWEAGPPHRVLCGFPTLELHGRGGTGSWTADDNLPKEC